MNHRTFRTILIVAMLATAATYIPAQPLDELVRIAKETHPSVAGLQLAIRRADAQAEGARSWAPPSAGVEVRMLPPGNPNPFAAGETMLMVEQMIPLFGQNNKMARVMAVDADVSKASLENLHRELRGRVEREYYTLWLLDRQQELNRENTTLAELLYSTAEARYSVDRAAQSDLFTISLEIGRLETERQTLAEERNEGVARLNALLSRPYSEAITIDTTLATPQLPPFASLLDAVGNHPSLTGMEAMATMKRAEAEAEEGMLDPMLMVRGGLAYMPDGHPLRQAGGGHVTGQVEHFGLMAGAMISIPIAPWSRYGPEAKAEADRLQAEEQLRERDAMQLEMGGMLRGAYGKAERARLRLGYYRTTQVPLVQQTLAALQNDYTNNRVPFSSVIDGYTMLVMARMEAYMSQMEYAMACSHITELTGVAL